MHREPVGASVVATQDAHVAKSRENRRGWPMPYFTEDHVRKALELLPERTHVSLVTFLAMLKSDVPATDTAELVPYGSEQENAVLNVYFRPPGGTAERPYYVPFGPHRTGIPRWKTADYSGSALQGMRTRKYGQRIYRSETDDAGRTVGYALRENLPTIFSNKQTASRTIGPIPLPVHLLCAWLYRNELVASHEAAIAKFTDEFRVDALGLNGTVFTTALDPQLSGVPLGDQPVPPETLTLLLEPPPGPSAAGSGTAEEFENEEATAPERDEEDALATPEGSWDATLASLDVAIADMRGVRTAAIQALSALRAGMHVIFTGPPGSGKTELAKRVCRAAAFDPLVVTATDSWTTFETIGGYFPQYDGEKERLDYEPGLVVRSMQDGRILVIDEINRADIDKAFGELFTLLSGGDVDLAYRRRSEDGGSKRIRLASTGTLSLEEEGVHTIRMPTWWRLIGAMNDSDKASLKRLSFAFMRRFAFIPVGIPGEEDYSTLVRDALRASGLDTSKPKFATSLVSIFGSSAGLKSISMPMGLAIPKAIIQQGVAELSLEPGRPDTRLLQSGIELYLLPQFQGRADKHEQLVALLEAHLPAEALREVEESLSNWTGYLS